MRWGDPMAAHAERRWPPAGNPVAARGEIPMAAVSKRKRCPGWESALPHGLAAADDSPARRDRHEHARRPKPPRVVGKHLSNGRSTMRKLVVALTVGVIGAGVVVSPAAAQPTGGPGEPTCRATVISNAAKQGPGRRAVAEFFFGDYPQAVRDAERAVQEACAS